jgi:hypothetical protein
MSTTEIGDDLLIRACNESIAGERGHAVGR